MKMSISGISCPKECLYCWVKQPAATRRSHFPVFLYSAASRMVWMDSSFAGSMKVQVLMMMTWASAKSSVIS